MKKMVSIIALLALIFIFYEDARFIVEEDDMVVITQFGKLVGETHKVPGEYFKIPFIQKTHYYKKRNFLENGVCEIHTLDKVVLNIELETIWKIDNPATFYRKFNSINLARSFINNEVKMAIVETVVKHKSNERIFESNMSDADHKFFLPDLGYETKEKAKDKVSEAGLILVSIDAKIVSQDDNP